MAPLKRNVLGIEIAAREIRMVEMRGGNPPQVIRAGSVPLPDKAIDGDRIVQMDAVSDLIRGLHSRLGCQSRSVVIGMGVQGVVTRVLDIPRVPDSELRVVLEGELAHYQILRTGAGAFDYFRLNTPEASEEGLPSVLLMAVEERVAQGYRQAVERAGLQVVALEPITLSLFRAAYPLLQKEPATVCLAITPQRSELSILDGGQIRIYRRIDLGSNDFVRGRKVVAPPLPGVSLDLSLDTETPSTRSHESRPARTLLNVDMESDTDELDGGLDTGDLRGGASGRTGSGFLNYGSEAGEPGSIIPQVVTSLASEVQRSLDYYQREFPDATAVTRIILPANDPEAAAVASLLSQSLQMEVSVVEPPLDTALPPQTLSLLKAPQGLQYLGAIGLALHAVTPESKQIPRFNLSVTGQSSAVPADRDRLTAVMVAAACILIGGLFAGFILTRNANGEADRLTILQKRLMNEKQNFDAQEKKIKDNMALDRIVKSDNLPVPMIFEQITRDMPPEMGLTSLNIQRNGQIALDGSARSLEQVYLYYTNLRLCPRFVGTQLTTTTTDPTTHIVTFHFDMALKGTQAGAHSDTGAL